MHGDAQVDEETVKGFHAALDPKLTMPMAQAAVKDFMAKREGWLTPAYVNAYARRMRDRNRPSEAAICAAMQRAGITGVREEQAYRRAVNQMVAEGKNTQEALTSAFSMQPDKFITSSHNDRIRPRQNVLTRQPARLHDIINTKETKD